MTSERILLRQILPSDIADIVEISVYDAVQATTIEEATLIQKKIDQDIHEGNSIHWGIADSVTNKLIGTCGYYRGFKNETGELGCVLLLKYRGKGLMTEALQLAIDFGIKKMGLKRICAITTKSNLNAIKLLKRLEFVKVAELENEEIEYELARKNAII